MGDLPAATPGNGATWRIAQFFTALTHRHDREVDQRLRRVLLNEAQWQLMARLAPFDRAHALRVRDDLVAAGYTDPDLLLAAALHDVGKADAEGRVGLAHRVLVVLLRRFAPDLLARVAQTGGRRLSHGLYLATNHARLGAELAADTGASERCCSLIARHEERRPVDDPELEALIAADEGALV